jgi:Transglutaminase-like superfamily/Coenzyme PQQ synthesis protein D (PqqD)
MLCPSGEAANKSGVRLLASEDGFVVLDVEHDRILKLNAVGAEIWKLLGVGDTESQVVQKIAQKYEVGEQRVFEDVRALIMKIEQLRLSPSKSTLAAQPKPQANSDSQPSYPWYGQTGGDDRSPKPKSELVIAAFLGLALFDLILFLSSLRSLCACVKAWPVSRQVSFRRPNAIGEICSSVQRACVWYPKQALCLQRSAVTTCLLRIYGIAAETIVGVRPMPFMAHAWVEVNGAVVNDWPGVKSFYCSLISQ